MIKTARIFGAVSVVALLSLLDLVSVAFAAPQAPGIICGTATNSAGALLPGVTVTLGRGTEKLSTTTTGQTGTFLLPKVPIGTYTLSFALEGFKMVRRMGVIITAGFELRADEQMVPSPPSKDADAQPVAPVGSSRIGGTFTKTIITNPAPPPPHPCTSVH